MVVEACRQGPRARLRVLTNLSVVGGISIPAKISGQNLSRSRFTMSDPHARVI